MRPSLPVLCLLVSAMVVAGCGTPDPQPQVSFASAAGAAPPAPALIPLEGALPDPKAPEAVAAAGEATAADGARLRGQAAAMRGPVISAAERRRLDAALARAAAERAQ